MILAINGIFASSMGIPSSPLLLDTYPNSTSAYSLRKLTNAYTGSAIRVRRSSDNTEQDIGFVADVLDTASLLSFCLATNGFVTKWYSQVGGSTFDVLQTTAIRQPKIVSTGVLNTLNLLACVTYALAVPTANSTALSTAAGVTVQNGEYFTCAVAASTTIAAGQGAIVDQDDQVTPSGRVAQYLYRNADVVRNLLFNTGGSFSQVSTPVFTANTQIVFNSSKVSAVLYAGLNNGVNNSSGFAGTPRTTVVKLSIGCGNNGISEFWQGSIQEAITFNGDNSANKTAIITNIKLYYGIV